MRSLVVGLGIGNLYVSVLKGLGAEVTTVDLDPSKGADCTQMFDALKAGPYDTVHICTPNFTHEDLYYQYTGFRSAHEWDRNAIVFIEKPGFATKAAWENASNLKQSRMMMVKNNQYRDNIGEMAALAATSNVKLRWLNEDRVPHPGSWFTTKKLAFGGGSRDLMPHLLSYMPIFFPERYKTMLGLVEAKRKWQLSDLTSSDYGSVKADGTYDVDDYARVEFDWSTNQIIDLVADWRTLEKSNVSVEFNSTKFELGLCPEDAYSRMILHTRTATTMIFGLISSNRICGYTALWRR